MDVRSVERDRKQFLDLLLLADEQEDMIDRYLDRGEMYALYDGELAGVCVVTDEGDGVLELKNLAIAPEFQRRGYGRGMIEWLAEHYRGAYRRMIVGTGDSPLTLPFYERCGFRVTHRVANFFTDHYDHPIFEAGVRLTDMVYLSQDIE